MGKIFLRILFGIKSAPEIFQKEITNILKNIECIENSMDDAPIYEHNQGSKLESAS